MALKVRIITKEGSTSAYVVFAQNHLLQTRQFAFDGRVWFYQPTTSSKFQQVNHNDLPEDAIKTMMSYTGLTREQLNVPPEFKSE